MKTRLKERPMRPTFMKFGPRLVWLAACAGAVAACSSSSGEGTTTSDGGVGSASSSGGEAGAASGSGSSSGAPGGGSGSGSGSGSSGSSGSISGGSGTGSVTGTLGGQVLTVKSALSAAVTNAGLLESAAYGEVILLTNIANACGLVNAAASMTIPGAQELTLTLGTNTPVAPGVFAIVTPTSTGTTGAAAHYQVADATCVTIGEEQAVSGSVTITAVTSSQMTGSFDIVFSPANTDGSLNTSQTDHVTGSFSAPNCPAFGVALNESSGDGPAPDAGVCMSAN